MRINIKPITVNHAWRGGRRFRTKEYLQYTNDLLHLLPKLEIPQGRLQLHLTFGVSNPGMDWDNAIKPFQDILQKKYGFNDNRVYQAIVIKKIVKKGKEFIDFEIKEYHKQQLKELIYAG